MLDGTVALGDCGTADTSNAMGVLYWNVPETHGPHKLGIPPGRRRQQDRRPSRSTQQCSFGTPQFAANLAFTGRRVCTATHRL
jgi:hypothetical protein